MEKSQHTISISIPTTKSLMVTATEYFNKMSAILKDMAETVTTEVSEAASETKAVTQVKIAEFIAKIKKIINNLFQKRRTSPNLGYQAPTSKDKKKYLKAATAALVVVLIVLSFFIGRVTKNGNTTYADTRPAAPTVRSQQVLNKEFNFPLADDKGVKVSTIKYKLTTIDMEDSIIVNGQRANAIKGRTFLILNLEITNNHTQGIEINSRDYVRLSVNGDEKWTAADIHNDPVAVQAISTKVTRLGFPISDSDKNLRLQIGEIKGKKQFITLELK